jgi:glycosyltransferase involved in cell wall biosynthesis
MAVSLGEILREKNCDILFLTPPWDFKPGSNHENVYTVKTPAKRLGALSRNFPIDITALWQLYRKLKSYKPDIVHINAKYLFLPSIIACSRLNIPTVFTVPDYFIFCPTTFIRKPDGTACTLYHGAHCCECLSKLSNCTARKMLVRIPRFFSKAVLAMRAKEFDYFLKKVSAYIALTEPSKQRMVNYGIPQEKINIIYHYRLAELCNTDVSISSPSAVFVGWLCEENGTDVLIEAFILVVRKIPHAKLYLVGEGSGPFIKRIKRRIAEGNITNNVVFLGKKDNKEALSIISKCDVVVVPHQWAKEFGPVILLEAMALGKPVITSKIGATEEFVQNGESGFLIDQYTKPQEFAKNIEYLLGNLQTAKKMGERGKDAAGSVLGDSAANKLIDLYNTLLTN